MHLFVHVSEYGDVNALPKNKNKSLVDLIGGNYKYQWKVKT